MRIRNFLDPVFGMEKFLSWINIPDPHQLLSRTFSEMVKAQTLSHAMLLKILLVVCAKYEKTHYQSFYYLSQLSFQDYNCSRYAQKIMTYSRTS
jgi:hypothetical protein